MRIGIFGGSFDPVHLGHLHVARQAAQRLHLDQIRFVPARLQPLKVQGPRARPNERMEMLRLALDGTPDFVIDRRELDRPGPSYTIDTLRELRRERPTDELFLLLGADAARDLPQWRESGELRKLASIIVVPRPGAPPTTPEGAVVLDMPMSEVSATAIREAANGAGTMSQLVPASVADYIAAHGLYRTGV